MSEHRAEIDWRRESPDFDYDSYNRGHRWRFDAGLEVAATAAPDFRGDPDGVDPEEAFVAAVASCHMLTFLALAARKRLLVDRYSDSAAGHLEKNADGKLAITRVVLRPRIEFGSEGRPTADQLARLHESAHRNCFIANSVRCDVTVEAP